MSTKYKFINNNGIYFISFATVFRWSQFLPDTGQTGATAILLFMNPAKAGQVLQFDTTNTIKHKSKNQIVLCYIFGVGHDELKIHKAVHRICNYLT